MTRSPGANSSTPGPTLLTTPANSPPGENGNGGLVWYFPAMISVSKKFNPTAATLATTSPAPATGSGISPSTSSSGGPKRWQRMAFTGGTLEGVGRCYSTDGGGGSPGEPHLPVVPPSPTADPPSHCRIPQAVHSSQGLCSFWMPASRRLGR